MTESHYKKIVNMNKNELEWVLFIQQVIVLTLGSFIGILFTLILTGSP